MCSDRYEYQCNWSGEPGVIDEETWVDDPSGGGGPGPTDPNPEKEKKTVDFIYIDKSNIGNESVIEFEEDNFLLIEDQALTFKFSPLKYSYNYNKTSTRTLGGEIIKIDLYNPTVSPANETVIHNTLGSATRNVTIFNISKKGIQNSNTTGRLTWTFSVNLRYSFSNPTRPTKTRTITKTYTKDISL